MRFYSYNKPKVHTFIDRDSVIGKVIEVSDTTGIRVELLEYDNLPGLVLTTQIAKYRVNLHKLFPIGKCIPLMIHNIDGDFINLSYKTLNDEKRKYYDECYKTRLRIYHLYEDIITIVKNMESLSNLNQEEIINEINQIMYFYMDYTKNKHLEDVYQYLLEDSIRLFKINEDEFSKFSEVADFEEIPVIYAIDKEVINSITVNMKSRIKGTELIVSLDFKLWVFGQNTLESLKNILTFDETDKIKINYVASPSYNIIINIGKDKSLLYDKIQSYKNIIMEKCSNYNKIKLEFDEPKILEDINYTYSHLPRMVFIKE